MKRGTLILAGAALSLVLGAAAFGFSAVSTRAVVASAPPKQVAELATAKRSLDDACSSATTYERLKTKLFDVALEVGDVEPEKLDLLAGSTVVRMEDPILKAKDEELGVTVCAGTFVVELPPGAEKAFDGKRRLEADIEYAAQVAADGSGMVYQLRGAEPITYRLAAFDLQGLPPLPALAPQPALASAEPILMPAELVPAAIVTPPAGEAKPVLDVADIAEAAEPKRVEPVEKPKAEKATGLAKKAEPAVKLEPAVAKTVTAAVRKADKAKPAKLAVKPKPAKAEIKHAAKPKPSPKPVEITAKSKPEIKTATKVKPVARTAAAKKAVTAPKPSSKPAIKIAKTVPAPKPVAKPAVKIAKAAPATKAMAKPAVEVAKLTTPKAPPQRKTSAPVIKASTPNFACGAGRPLSERLMCANPSLGAKERRMMGVYYSALDNADGRTRRVLQETAGDFLAYRNNCRTEACLSGAFDERTAEIRDIMADGR